MLKASDIDHLYPFPAIRCRRIVRDTERRLGDFRLDGSTAFALGTDNIGVFLGGCKEVDGMIDPFRNLSEADLPGQIVIALSTNAIADEFYDAFSIEGSGRTRPAAWTKGAVTFTTPEKLRAVDEFTLEGRPVLAVGLVDPWCIVNRARGGYRSGYPRNDRPQHLAKFRAAHAREGWRPPFLLFTTRPAKSVSPNQMLAPYSLDAWWFADGRHLRTGAPPASRDARSTETPPEPVGVAC